MIYSILEKCLAELNKDEVDFSYIRGMLEVLLEMQDKPKSKVISGQPLLHPLNMDASVSADTGSNEGSILDAKARASLEQIKALSEASKG